MAKTIKTVALAGATGNVGANVLTALLSHQQFAVTVLTRSATGKSFPPTVTTKEVDFTSIPSLTTALSNIDALIDTTQSNDALPALNLLASAVAAGVYRYIPSDFGLNPANPAVHALPVFQRKKASLDAAKAAAAAAQSGFTYTVVANGPFLDWNLATAFMGIDLQQRKATLFDGGGNVFNWTTLASIGRATVGVLLKAGETENRVVYISDVVKSQGQLLEKAREVLGGEWEVGGRDMDAVLEKSLADMKAGILTWDVFGDQIRYAAAKRELSSPWERDDNELLGLKGMTDGELGELIKKLAAQPQPSE